MTKRARIKNDFIQHPIFMLCQMLFVLLLIYVAFLPHRDTQFDNENCLQLDDGWVYEDASGAKKIVSLPADLETNIPNGVRLTNTLPEETKIAITSIAKYSVFQVCKIYVDGKLILDSTDPYLEQSNFSKATGPFWEIADLPENCHGKSITLEVTSPYPTYQKNIGRVLLGSKNAIIYDTVHSEFYRFLIGALFVLAGVVFICFFLLQRKFLDKSHTVFVFGCFMIWTGLWLFSESYLTQLICSNSLLVNVIAFLSIRMMFISFIEYILCQEITHGRKLLRIVIYAAYAEALISIMLQLLHVLDFYESIIVFHVLLAVSLLFVVLLVVQEIFRYRNRKILYLWLCILVLCVCALVEIFLFYGSTTIELGQILIIGLLISAFIIAQHEIRRSIHVMKKGREASYYEELAMHDFLTHCGTRTAMQKTIDQKIDEIAEHELAAVLVCDVNNLKKINDSLGHAAGDDAIIRCANLLQETFSSIGTAYRTGGDEFTCLVFDCEEMILEQYVKKFMIKTEQCNKECEYDFAIAIGFAYFNTDMDRTIENTMRRADFNMYQMKKKMKKKDI